MFGIMLSPPVVIVVVVDAPPHPPPIAAAAAVARRSSSSDHRLSCASVSDVVAVAASSDLVLISWAGSSPSGFCLRLRVGAALLHVC